MLDFRPILSLPFASNPWIFGGFESPVQLKGVCSIFVALDSSLPLGKRNNAASRAQKKKPLMAENRVSPSIHFSPIIEGKKPAPRSFSEFLYFTAKVKRP